jgi:tetratricopeptide (TPR) repeat protein
MKRILVTLLLCVGIGLADTAAAQASQFDTELAAIQDRWAVINYETPDPAAREREFAALSEQAHELAERNPQRAEAFIWEGIVLSTYAGAKGGLGALSLAKQSRKALETALHLQPDALQGAAYTSLGALYSKVPGFPLGFGDDAKAQKLLLQALAVNPDGIDPNYFYADFLCDQDKCAQAIPYLERAAQAPHRPGRELADAGRHREIVQLLQKARS